MSGPKTAVFYGDSDISAVVKRELPDADITVYPTGLTDQDIDSEEKLRALSETEIIFGFPILMKNILPRCSKLRWIQVGSAGVDRVLQAQNNVPFKDQVTVTRNGETFGRPLSEYIISQILAVNLGQYKWHDQQKDGVYKRDPVNSKPLSLSSIAILGLGFIGREVARICKCFGMKVWAMTRTPVLEHNKSSNVDEYRTTPCLPELLSECDYIVNIMPSTKETRGLLSGDVFSNCQKKKTTFINVGRGDVTDEDSLLRALRNGWLQYAVLDVHSTEPLPADSFLWKEPGVIITPHISGGFILHPEYLQDRAYMFVKQFRRYVNKEPLKYVVDEDRGY